MAFSSLETHTVIDVMTRLKTHHMALAGASYAAIAEDCAISVRSVERVLTEPVPTREEVAADVLEGRPRRGRPSKADDAVLGWVKTQLAEDPRILATEVLRRSRAHGYRGGRSAMSALVKSLRPTPTAEPFVRFEGLPGEYTQFDFGEAWLRYSDGRREKIVFFAARLKYSRLMHVVVTADQKAETLVRSVIRSLTAFGGSTKEWVFDNPKTVRISPMSVKPPVLHAYLRDIVAAYRVIPTLCAARSGNQKGSVERLVGFVKRSFLFARKFIDRADVERQLVEWLAEVNDERKCDATGVIPRVAWEEERSFLELRPVRTVAAEHVLREPRIVGPAGTVSFEGTSYFASARRLGAAATLLVREKSVEVVLADVSEGCVHIRREATKTVQRLPEQRVAMLGVLHGRRKVATFRRQCLLELGRDAFSFLTVLVHTCADGCWEAPCTELFELLTEHGDDAMRAALARCVFLESCTVDGVRHALREVA